MREGRLNLLMSLLAVFDENERDETSYVLARYFLEHFDRLDQLSIYDVMDECFVSRSGVRRFCQSIGFDNFSEIKARSDEYDLFRSYFLRYVDVERDGQHDLRNDLAHLYDGIDALVASGAADPLVRALHDCDDAALFSADSSSMSLREFQRAMVGEGKVVQLITESSPAADAVRSLGPNDVLVVVSTSGVFARRVESQVSDSEAYKAYVTARRDEGLEALYDDVLVMGTEGSQGTGLAWDPVLHRVFASYGVAYLFDRLFDRYARAYDPTEHALEDLSTCGGPAGGVGSDAIWPSHAPNPEPRAEPASGTVPSDPRDGWKKR